jgi:hypothetical protein
MRNNMTPANIKQRIKKTLNLLASKQRGGIPFVMVLRSGRNLLRNTILASCNRTPPPTEADKSELQETIHEAQIAYEQGRYRLALLLAHQCDCISEHPTNPDLEALLADLGQKKQNALH